MAFSLHGVHVPHRNMLKKIICIALALLLFTFAFSACGADTEKQEPDDSSQLDDKDTNEEDIKVVLPDSYNLQFDNKLEGIYNYCPSIMQMDENTAYIYYCTNRESYNIIDYVGFRKGTRNEDGSWSWGKERQVLAPRENMWDAHHTCDPSVVMGNFKYEGEEYSYLMAYLGCTSYDNQDNKIGLAVAKAPEGPFIRVGDALFIDFEFDGSEDIWEWGVGQPSLINLDKEGHVLIFYTRGDRNGTRTLYEEWDLCDLSSPKKLCEGTLSKAGLKDLNGNNDIMNNADFVYDAEKDRFYAVSDCHPGPSSEPSYIASHFRITYFDKTTDYESIVWNELAVMGNEQTGYPRNHNVGVLRDAYGYLPNQYLSAFYTISIESPDSLWAYRIYDCHVQLP